MNALLAAIALLSASGVSAALAGRYSKWPGRIALFGAAGAALLSIVPCAYALSPGHLPVTLSAPWDVPGGAFVVRLDALSALFILPIVGISLLCAVYGQEYMRGYAKPAGGFWCFYNLLVASMMMVVIAHNALLFLVAWEMMAVASFFLVRFESERKGVEAAAWTYLVAAHLGTAALLAMFVIAGGQGGSLDFAQFGEGIGTTGRTAVFALALVGFGAKAGFAPLHVWLPDAHPAAPSHVSALMSGVMIKTGIYGLVRIVQILDAPPLWWGWTLIFIGLASGIGGVLFALAQHDLKRLLAYHSVENIGIIALGLGMGLVGWSTGIGTVCLLGLAGALLHVVNHAVFKSLLFLGAGAIHHGTHSLDMDHLGGLLKRMPRTGGPFLIGALAISGLPPLNGFVSEFLVFLAALTGIAHGGTAALAPSVAVIAGLALISGLAAACFTKAFGSVFLGEPREERMQRAHDPGWRMFGPMFGLAGMCLVIGLGGPIVVPWVYEAALTVRPELSVELSAGVLPAKTALVCVTVVFAALLLFSCALALLRKVLLRGRAVTTAGTWDCGYAAPTARMQYTSSSFAEPLTQLFQAVLRTRRREPPLAELFPEHATYRTDTPDTCMEGVYRSVFKGIERMALYVRWLQHGNIHLYILYIAVTLLVLLVWKLS